jgi:uncharacterized protein YbjT (DUF2867 family)
MKVVLFGATGMIGQAVLRECLVDAEGLARAMLSVAKRGTDRHVLEVVDINRVANA